MSSAAVSVHGLTKSYGRLTALADVSFTIRPGEVLGLIGPNGAGKTTLFECMAGVLPYEAGTVKAPGIFYVPDGIAPWPSQPVGWVLDFAIGFFRGRADRRAGIVERLDLAPFLSSPIGTLSKGQRKRAVLAVAMLTPHPVLLIDEPFDGLDLRQTREVGAALRDHAASGRTLFLSIHQISDAARVCDRFVLLSGGRVRGEGTLSDLSDLVNRRNQQNQNQGNLRNPGTPRNLEDVVLALT